MIIRIIVIIITTIIISIVPIIFEYMLPSDDIFHCLIKSLLVPETIINGFLHL